MTTFRVTVVTAAGKVRYRTEAASWYSVFLRAIGEYGIKAVISIRPIRAEENTPCAG